MIRRRRDRVEVALLVALGAAVAVLLASGIYLAATVQDNPPHDPPPAPRAVP